MKLSKTQIRVLQTLKKGETMTKLVTSVILKGGCRVDTFFSLSNNLLIKPFGQRKFGQEWRITQKGIDVLKSLNHLCDGKKV